MHSSLPVVEWWSGGVVEWRSGGTASDMGFESYEYSHIRAQRAHGILAQGSALGRHEQNIAG